MEQSLGRDSYRDAVLQKYALVGKDKAAIKPFIVYRGIAGIGKTNLLQAHISDVRSLSSGYGFYVPGQEILAGVSQDESGYVDRAGVVFLRRVAAGIDPNLVDSGYYDQIDVIDPNDAEALHNGFVMTAEKLGSISQLNPVFLGFDDWDGDLSSFFRAIHSRVERELMVPIARNPDANIVVAMATRREVRFSQFEVRRLVEEKFVNPLDLTENWTLMQDTGDRILYPLTQGIPLLGEYLVNHYGIGFLNSLDGSRFLYGNLSQITYELAEQMVQRIPELHDPELRTIFDFICQFREFDVHTLRNLLPVVHPEFKDSSQSRYMQAVKGLLQPKLITWSDEMVSYAVNTPLRKVFANKLRFNAPDAYRSVHEVGAQYYMELLKNVPRMRGLYAKEYVFHRVLAGSDVYSAAPFVEDIKPHLGAPSDEFSAFTFDLARDTEIGDALKGL